MSIGRPAIIAAQAVVVGVLVVVVYLTLLRPEDEGTLSGVDAPGGAQVTQRQANPSDQAGRRGGDRAGGREGSPGDGAASGSTFVPGTAGSAVGALPVAALAPTTEPGGGPGNPSSDQYLNAVSRLTERLR